VNAGCVGTGSEAGPPFDVQGCTNAVGAWMRRNGLLVTLLWRFREKSLDQLGETKTKTKKKAPNQKPNASPPLKPQKKSKKKAQQAIAHRAFSI